jgi:Phosphatidylserine/phosphatidylglycerophosphate/cardiolipin synthases and related enzymes
MYGLTHPAIVDALVAAKNPGVHVALKLDKLESAGKTQAVMITKLQAASVPVEVSEQARLLHHKFAVIDGRYVVTGSYNRTESTESSTAARPKTCGHPKFSRRWIFWKRVQIRSGPSNNFGRLWKDRFLRTGRLKAAGRS